MEVKMLSVRFKLQRDELLLLLLLNGSVNVVAETGERFSLNGMTNHKKYGIPGSEDGSNHFFDSFVGHNGHYRNVTGACLRSHDDGKTYEGSISFEVRDPKRDLD